MNCPPRGLCPLNATGSSPQNSSLSCACCSTVGSRALRTWGGGAWKQGSRSSDTHLPSHLMLTGTNSTTGRKRGDEGTLRMFQVIKRIECQPRPPVDGGQFLNGKTFTGHPFRTCHCVILLELPRAVRDYNCVRLVGLQLGGRVPGSCLIVEWVF